MLGKAEIQALNILIDQIDVLVEKYGKKAGKERAKRDNAYVTYKGDKYYTDADLQDAYACDAFSDKTYDRLLYKLNQARGSIDSDEYTPTQMIIIQLQNIQNGFRKEIKDDERQREDEKRREERFAQLAGEGYSFREATAIIGNEELMRFE